MVERIAKIILWILGIAFILLWIIADNHRDVERQWGEWKTLTLDGAKPERPGFCFYCTYIRPLIESSKR